MDAIVKQQPDKKWCVMRGDDEVHSDLSNGQAWRLADKINNEFVNRQEAVREWVFNQIENKGQ